jgi:hypothetical protein
VKVEIEFNSPDDMETILKMGFQEGFTMGVWVTSTIISVLNF